MKDLKIFSPTEAKILKILGRRKLTITELTEKFHEGKPPAEANNTIAAAVRRIRMKTLVHDLNWTIHSFGMGRAGKTVWRDKI